MVHLVRQDLSIAGKRAGLAGARSGLYMEQIRIIREMREHDRTNGRTGEFIRPRYMVWENVPGAFSSNKGEDFGAALHETIRIVCPKAPPVSVPKNGWPTSGCIVGDEWSLAWRVLDAQFWGVPQRRRRIALVADFAGQSAPEILFEREIVSGDSEPGEAPREGTSGAAAAGTYPAIARSITARYDGSPCIDSGPNIVFCLQGNGIDRAETAGCNGRGWKEDVSYTLNTIDRPAVCAASILDMTHANDVIRECGDIVPTLQTRMGSGGNQVPLTYGIGNGQANEASIMAEEVSQTLNTMHDAQAVMCEDVRHALRAKANCAYREDAQTYICSAVDCRNGQESDVGGALQARTGHTLNANGVVRSNMVVRRLTPLECTRLQGYPDGWVDIGDWVDEKGKKHKDADSPKYKALGNSIALPFWDWMLRRMARYLPEGATLGSLFDGISGFNVCWARIHGAECCRWSSEIEQFPIAVTKKHFGDEEAGKEGDWWKFSGM